MIGLPKPIRLSSSTSASAKVLSCNFLTSGPNPVIATCGGMETGGKDLASCLVLDTSNGRWDESMMGDLRRGRSSSEVVRLDSVGVYIIGSHGSIGSDFLPAGTRQWQNGPALPDDMRDYDPGSVAISETSFLAICSNDIREFDASISGPTSREGWREAGRWPSLKTWRGSSPGCTKLGQKVIIAGGWDGSNRNNEQLRSTEVLDLQTREISYGGDMAERRMWFHSGAIIGSGGWRLCLHLAGTTVEVA